eukprot:5651697-Pleurochrysis_carterae.AAC.1
MDFCGDLSLSMGGDLQEPKDESPSMLVEEAEDHLLFEGGAGEISASRVREVPLARREDGTAPRSSLRAMSKETIRP